MGDSSAIFVQKGISGGKQTTLCLWYTTSQRLPMLAIVPWWATGDAVRLVKDGRVNTIVTAFDSKTVQKLAEDIDGYGQVVFVHPQPHVIVPAHHSSLPLIADLIRRWHRAGRRPEDIARDIGSETTDVRAILRKDDGTPG